MTAPPIVADAVSPSLRAASGRDRAAYEMKFLLDEAQAAAVEAWARRRLAPDPHGDPALGGAYRTTSLYCDTPELHVYRRAPGYRRRKFRVRRYGTAPWLFLERKTKNGDRVLKRRTPVALDELAQLAPPLSPEDWPGFWFQRKLLARGLGPACLVAYERAAHFGEGTEGPLRLTMDRHVEGVPAGAWALGPVVGGLPLLTGRVILEFKFEAALPAAFKEVIAELCLAPSKVSKYRACREAWGVPVVEGVAHG